ncbi:signal transduction histidine kinase [Thermocatellispora tengchongensis]|uniref:histidine kinase n=1 Tax=Thermocatellispora tengchongensis TaxID=1073253 RepID=A0A840PK66_9ACTN|nr:histidine kinase [Thermocatellispora tengchongensis]MBB5138201.1 signal transduction histidine kinase [Thermocatellispora tengchongensis]
MFGSLQAWARNHPVAADTLSLSPLVLFCVLSGSAVINDGRLGPAGFVLLSVALLAPLPWRRRRPVAVFAAVSAISFVQWLAGVDVLVANTSVVVAMYTVTARCSLRWAVAAGLVAELGLVMATIRWEPVSAGPTVTSSAFLLAIWIGGRYAHTRHRYLESLEERAERAERERDQQARIAAAAERARIARELHDVVAHNVSVIIVQADGAGYAIDSDPETAKRAVQTISATGRQALAEMRRLVGVLRQDGGPEQEDYTPQPGLAQLDALVAQVRESGLAVDLHVSGTPADLPEGEQLTVYRIVQEALTNTIKHGGPGARASVDLAYGPHELVLAINDDGRGAAAPRSPGGHGLIGMYERVAMYGGTVYTGPRPGGGFQVLARLPLHPAPAAHPPAPAPARS